MNRYAREFLSLRCSGDILNVVNPITSGFEKEVSEAMAVIKLLRGRVLKNPGQYNILDLCAGNALGSIISSFLLPINKAVAVDIKPLNRRWSNVRNFQYKKLDIVQQRKKVVKLIDKNTIIISVHPCARLAREVVDIYTKSDANALFIMPCCEGSYEMPFKGFLKDKLGNYSGWCFYLADYLRGCRPGDKIKIKEDENCISEKNTIIYVAGRARMATGLNSSLPG